MDLAQQKITDDVSTQDVINAMKVVKDTFTALGIIGIDPCDPSGSIKRVTELAEEYYAEAKKIIDEFLFYLSQTGQFALGLLLMMAEFLGTTLLALIESVVAEGFSKLLGILNSFIMYILSALKGIEYIIQYYALKFLKELIIKRSAILKELDQDFSFLKSYIELLNFNVPQNNSSDIKILKEVNKLLKSIITTLAIEYKLILDAKNKNQNKLVNVQKIKSTESKFNKIFSLLTRNNYTILITDLKFLIKELQLNNGDLFDFRVDPVSNIKEIIDKVATALYRKYLAIDTDDQDYKIKLRKSIEKLKPILSKINPVINNLILTAVLYDSFNIKLKSIAKKVPVFSGNLDITELYKDREVNKYTLSNLNSSIKISESLIIIFKSWWPTVLEVADFQRIEVLRSSLESLKKVNSDIENSIKENDSSFTTRLLYYSSLQLPYTQLSSLNQSYNINLGSGNSLLFNPGLTISAIDTAKKKLEDITKFLVKKNIDIKTKNNKPSPAEKIYLIASKGLVSLFLNVGLVIFGKERRNLVKKLVSIDLLINEQIKQDMIELSLINSYINTMDSIPEFVALKNLVEKFLSENAGNSLGAELLKGDLASVSNLIGLGKDIIDLATLSFCKKNENSFVLYELINPNLMNLFGIDMDKHAEKMDELQHSIINLKNKENTMNFLMNTLNNTQLA